MATINTLTIDVVLNGKKAQMGLKSFLNELKKVNKTATNVNKNFKGIGSGLSLSHLVGAGTLAGVIKFSQSTMDVARNIDNLSARTSISSQKLLALKKAFSSTSDKGEGLGKVIKNIDQELFNLKIGQPSKISRLVGAYGMKISQDATAEDVLYAVSDWAKSVMEGGVPEAGKTPEQRKQFLVRAIEQTGLDIEQTYLDELLKGSEDLKTRISEEMPRVLDAGTNKKIVELSKSINETWASVATMFRQSFGDFVETVNPQKFVDIIRKEADRLSESSNKTERNIIVGGSVMTGLGITSKLLPLLPVAGSFLAPLAPVAKGAAILAGLGTLWYGTYKATEAIIESIPPTMANETHAKAINDLYEQGKINRGERDFRLAKIRMSDLKPGEKETILDTRTGKLVTFDNLGNVLNDYEEGAKASVISSAGENNVEITIENNTEINAPNGNAEEIRGAVIDGAKTVASVLTGAIYSTISGR